ncbi:hypothetical protein ENBRE01_0682 [Enteropsectra breve]|nr:hypothetical protein ENBRE01_0682 [Enteropsectra breve]
MNIRVRSKQFTVNIDDLKEKTVKGLKEYIAKECLKDTPMGENDKMMMICKTKKINEFDDLALDDSKVNVTNDDDIYVIIVGKRRADSGADAQRESATPKKKSKPDSMPSNKEDSFNAKVNAYMNNPDSEKIFKKFVEDPVMTETIIDSCMPNASEEQKNMVRQSIEELKNNPARLKEAMELSNKFMENNPYMNMGNPMMQNQMMGNPMMGNPMMQNPMMQNPMMQNPMMQNPMMQSPIMGNPYMNMSNPMMQSPMMGNPYYPQQMMYFPWMQMGNSFEQPPKEGPCCHGFYPRNDKDKPKKSDSAASKNSGENEDILKYNLMALQEFGYKDEEQNKKALNEANGDLNEALDILKKKYQK